MLDPMGDPSSCPTAEVDAAASLKEPGTAGFDGIVVVATAGGKPLVVVSTYCLVVTTYPPASIHRSAQVGAV